MSGDDPKVSLPAFGLADDILARLEAEVAAKKAAQVQEPAPAPKFDPRSPSRIIDFAGLLGENNQAEQAQSREREHQLLSFLLAGEEFALHITHVREIVRVGGITRIPEAPEHVRGVMNLRGRILPLVELRSRLGLPPLEIDAASRVIVVEAYGRYLGLLVDMVDRIQKVVESALREPPPEIRPPLSDYIVAVVQLPERLAILLDAEKVLLLPSRTNEAKP